jgi:hypothetical protein
MGCAAAANFCSRVVFIRNVFNTFCCCNVGCNRDINICTFIKKNRPSKENLWQAV